MRNTSVVIRAISLAIVLSSLNTFAATVKNGNLIVSVTENPQFQFPPKYVAEFTTTGQKVQVLSNVPPPGNDASLDERSRGVALMGNSVYVLDGDANVHLAKLNLANTSWTQQIVPGWQLGNDSDIGPLVSDGRYLYTVYSTLNADFTHTSGILRFDTQSSATTIFGTDVITGGSAPGLYPTDLAIGPNGTINALGGAVYKFNPTTLAMTGSRVILTGVSDPKGLAVASDGSLFVSGGSSPNENIVHCSASGALIKSLATNSYAGDLAINSAGKIAMGNRDGGVLITDTSLNNYSFFLASSPYNGTSFVAWVPEPSALLLLPAAAMLFRRRQ
jgi:hypothetical protein